MIGALQCPPWSGDHTDIIDSKETHTHIHFIESRLVQPVISSSKFYLLQVVAIMVIFYEYVSIACLTLKLT